MKIKKSTRLIGIIKRTFNVHAWLDVDRVKSATTDIGQAMKGIFVPKRSKKPAESFEDAMERMHLTNKDLAEKGAALFRLSMLMLLVAILILGYAGYELYYGAYKATIVSLAVSLIALALAFRYHFWSFQIKVRKLGCSLGEWYRGCFKRNQK